MSVLIKDMEMPTRCVDCWMMDGDDCLCSACRGRYLSPDYRYGIKDKPEWCPLVPVSEHGEMEVVPSAQPETDTVARDIATILQNEQDMRVILKNAQPTHDDGSNALDALDCVAQRMGEWIYEGSGSFSCSECGKHQHGSFSEIYLGEFHFCPNCGAKMEGSQDE